MNKKLLFIGSIIVSLCGVWIFVWAQNELQVDSVMIGSTPTSFAEVYRGMSVSYNFDFLFSGVNVLEDVPESEQPELKLAIVSSQYVHCTQTEITQKIITSYASFVVSCDIKNEAPWKADIVSPNFSASIDGNPLTESLTHEGFVMVDDVFKNDSLAEEFAKDDENLNTTLSFSVIQHPNRLLNGTSDAHGNILHRTDKADMSSTEMNLTKAADNGFYNIYPKVRTITSSEVNLEEINKYSDTNSDDCTNQGHGYECRITNVSSCVGEGCSIMSSGTLCSINYKSDLPIGNSGELIGDVTGQTLVRYYSYTDNNFPNTIAHLGHIPSIPLRVVVKVDLPQFPTLNFNSSHSLIATSKTNTYQVLNLGTSIDANKFVLHGFTFAVPASDFISYAYATGKSGNVIVNVKTAQEGSKNMYKTTWKYVSSAQNINCQYQKKDYSYCCGWNYFGCSRNCLGWGSYSNFNVPYKTYEWERIEEPKKMEFELTDSTSVDVFSSAAWVQTKGGHLGTNNYVSTTGTEFNNFKFSSGEILSSLVMSGSNSCGTSSCIRSIPLDYTPMNQSNADFMVYAGGDPDRNSFTSKANWYKEIENDTEASSNENEKKYGYGLRGDEYDRENYPRQYTEDLLDRENFGEVIDFGTLTDFTPFGNVQKNGNTFTFIDTLFLQQGAVYVFPENASIVLGRPENDLALSGSSARLYVTGLVKIEGNIVYASHRAKNYLTIPNLRIEAKRIEVNKDVEYIESQLQADYFETGVSSRQLRILGDVIAKETHFQREPTSVSSPEEMENNPPSEMIIEDMRKYLIPAPGDTVLRDSYDMWQQVNPITGEIVDPY